MGQRRVDRAHAARVHARLSAHRAPGAAGIVVSRVSFSPLLASQLVDLLNEQWQAYTQESGVPTEDNGDD